MADIRPFRGLRYDPSVVGEIDSVVTPPYDVIDPNAQAEFYRRSPHNIIRVELGMQLPHDSAEENRYSRARQFLQDWLRSGVLKAEPKDAIYVYQHSFPHRDARATRTGFLAAMRLEKWQDRIVLPHEATMAGPKLDRIQLMRATGINCSPIFALYRDPRQEARAALDRAIKQQPVISISVDGEEHKLWALTESSTTQVLVNTINGAAVYIADGHHRYETALFFRDEQRAAHPQYRGDEPWNYVMTLLVGVDGPGLLVLPTHRMVRPREVNTRILQDLFSVQPQIELQKEDLPRLLFALEKAGRDRAHVFGYYSADSNILPVGFGTLSLRAEASTRSLMPADRSEAWRSLDVSVLHELLLKRTFALTDHDAEDERIAYTREEQVALQSVLSGKHSLALFLNPTRVEQVLDIANSGDVMPHKSTYFHPKPLTGLVLNRLI